jgi:hypothetical protein
MSVKEDFTFLAEQVVSIGSWDGAAAASYVEIGHIEDTVTVNDGRDVTTFEDWDAAKNGVKHKLAEGARNITISFTVLIVLTDAAYASLRTKYTTGVPAAIKIVAADSKASGGKTETLEYAVEITQFNRTYAKNNVATLALTFEVSDIITETLANTGA